MTTYQMTTKIEHVETELGQQGFARLNLLANGEQICHQDFGCNFPTTDEIIRTRQGLAFQLYYNPKFFEYQKALYYLAFPYGE